MKSDLAIAALIRSRMIELGLSRGIVANDVSPKRKGRPGRKAA